MASCIQGREFASYVLSQNPIYADLILRDIRPDDGWIGTFSTGTWDAFSGTEQIQDRFRNVMPNVTKQWQVFNASSCIGTPCDPPRYEIGWGYERRTYYRERQVWKTQLLCFDQILTKTRAKEHFQQIISDVLRPATSYIMSHFMRKRAADYAGKKWLASAAMTDFTFTWDTTGDEEIFIDTSGEPTSRLTPQMLQRRVFPLMQQGYMGKQPFRDMPPLIELVTDLNTAWDLDKIATDTNVNDRWRFNEWPAANAYYKYNFGGQLGNYVVRVDPFILRFNKVTTNRFQLVLPYVNVATTEGIGSEPNPDFELAQYQFSYIVHRMALMFLVAKTETVNPLMPFANRSLAGEWQFAMNNLGADCNGVAIDNTLMNKGLFIASFDVSAKPQYTEFLELIFHKREPAVVYAIDTCAEDPGDPEQDYNSANDNCNNDNLFCPEANEAGNFVIDASSITCDGTVVENAEITASNISDLVNSLNTDPATSALGFFSAVGSGCFAIVDTDCASLQIPFNTE